MKGWKWLYPGLGVKRWILLMAASFFFFSVGLAILTEFSLATFIEENILGLILPLTGNLVFLIKLLIALIFFILSVIGINLALKSASKWYQHNTADFSRQGAVEQLYKKKQLEKGPKIVALGGGTGLSNLLRGLKHFTSNITAIVTVADDGGSSGKLRDELGTLPPGDIRNCLVALADAEPLMMELFQYRFSSKGHLVGHSFGNLFIAALAAVLGDFEEAVKESSKILAISGQVLPATNQDVRLGAIYADKSVRLGESVIAEEAKKIERVFLKPAKCQPTNEALKSVSEADIIIIGPGSLYTSIIPNLLVEGIAEAIKESKALKFYVCNVMTQPGETSGYTVNDHVRAIIDHSVEGLFDYVVVNREESTAGLIKKYEAEGAFPVKVDRQQVVKNGIRVIEADLLSAEGFIRHDPIELARTIFHTATGW